MKAGMPARRFLLVAVFAYVLLDLGCPSVPGAFSFDPADSVDAVSAYRARPPALPRVASVPFATTSVRVFEETAMHAAGSPSAPSPVGWRPHAIRDHAAAPDPRPSVEDD
jgi:hypothetical protein